jgi:hypothetical protein
MEYKVFLQFRVVRSVPCSKGIILILNVRKFLTAQREREREFTSGEADDTHKQHEDGRTVHLLFWAISEVG